MPSTVLAKPTRRAPPTRRYPMGDAFFKEVIDDAIVDALCSPVALAERQIVRLKHGFDTACWAFLPPHRIYIGTDLFEKETVKLGLSEALQRQYVANHYHHELGHALFTTRDMPAIQAALKSMKCPFSLYNLFEDAYMEERYRNEAEYRFEWLQMEDARFNSRPESLLFALIQAEGDVDTVGDNLAGWTYDETLGGRPDGPIPIDTSGVSFAPNVKAALEGWLPKVVAFFQRSLRVKESMALMPIVKAWIDVFGLPPQPENGGMSDLEFSAKLMGNPQFLAEFDKDTVPVSGEASGQQSSPISGLDRADKPVAAQGTVLGEPGQSVDMNRVKKVVDKLKKFFEQTNRRVSTTTPQKRISARHFALGRAPYRKAELQGRARKQVLLIFDCSASMDTDDGYPAHEGRILVAALSELARQGYATGHVVFSGVFLEPVYETYALPMTVSTISRVQGRWGAEGLEPAIRANLGLAKEADYVFVYTDANICDDIIKKDELHLQGVYTWGLYAGTGEDHRDNLLLYFDKAIQRDNAEDLVDAMLAQSK